MVELHMFNDFFTIKEILGFELTFCFEDYSWQV
jgi:hypothetical protein